MRKVVKIVYSRMYESDDRISFLEKVLVTTITLSILLTVISFTIIKSI
ncbi:MAG: hypothetical protein JKX68_01710 [Flavobacteriales bacterium]|nr:hypothetical protein [Flavobacteriales bacterium]